MHSAEQINFIIVQSKPRVISCMNLRIETLLAEVPFPFRNIEEMESIVDIKLISIETSIQHKPVFMNRTKKP